MAFFPFPWWFKPTATEEPKKQRIQITHSGKWSLARIYEWWFETTEQYDPLPPFPACESCLETSVECPTSEALKKKHNTVGT